jgi:hypothetical protein
MGQSASEQTLRRIQARSLGHLSLALNPEKSGIEIIRVYGNSEFEGRPNLALGARRGRFICIANNSPARLQSAHGSSRHALDVLRKQVARPIILSHEWD